MVSCHRLSTGSVRSHSGRFAANSGRASGDASATIAVSGGTSRPASESIPGTMRRSAPAASRARSSMSLSGVTTRHASGSVRATIPGAKTPRAAVVASGPIRPIGAVRVAKYPIQKPLRPTDLPMPRHSSSK